MAKGISEFTVIRRIKCAGDTNECGYCFGVAGFINLGGGSLFIYLFILF